MSKKTLPGEDYIYSYEKHDKIYYGYVKQFNTGELDSKGKPKRKLIEKRNFTSKQSAKQSLHKLIARYENHPESIINPKIKLSDLIEKWLEGQLKKEYSKGHLQSNERILRRFKELIGNIPIDSINSSHLSKFIEMMKKKKCKESTIDLNITILRSCLNSAKKFYPKLMWNPPTLEQRVFKSERIEPEVTVDMINRIIKSLIDMNTQRSLDVADMVLISSQMALRIGEIVSLKWINVSLISGIRSPHGLLKFISEKTREIASVRITRDVKQIFIRRLESNLKQERVFEWGTQQNSQISAIEELFKKACNNAGILYGRDISGGIRFHSLRHFVARSLLDAGHDLATVGAYGRWNQKSMVMLYGKATLSSIDLGGRSMEDLFDSSRKDQQQLRKVNQ